MLEWGNYRGIKVTHSMKLRERKIDSRFIKECTVSGCQYEFHSGHGTMDPIIAQKYKTKNTSQCCLFLDMQKIFDFLVRWSDEHCGPKEFQRPKNWYYLRYVLWFWTLLVTRNHLLLPSGYTKNLSSVRFCLG